MSQNYRKVVCQLDHGDELPQRVLDWLPENQSDPVRHRCAACAYAAGMQEGAKDVGRLLDMIRELTAENERLRRALGRGDTEADGNTLDMPVG